jgi:hypothetical protein
LTASLSRGSEAVSATAAAGRSYPERPGKDEREPNMSATERIEIVMEWIIGGRS